METIISSEPIGKCKIELVKSAKGYECRVHYMGDLKYSMAYPNEVEACQAFNRSCVRWLEAAERAAG